MIQIECLGTRDSRLRLSVFDRPAMKSHVLLYGSEEGARDFEETGGKPNVSGITRAGFMRTMDITAVDGGGPCDSQLRYSIRKVDRYGWMDQCENRVDQTRLIDGISKDERWRFSTSHAQTRRPRFYIHPTTYIYHTRKTSVVRPILNHKKNEAS